LSRTKKVTSAKEAHERIKATKASTNQSTAKIRATRLTIKAITHITKAVIAKQRVHCT